VFSFFKVACNEHRHFELSISSLIPQLQCYQLIIPVVQISSRLINIVFPLTIPPKKFPLDVSFDLINLTQNKI
jgi:hypothetical protein